MQQEIIKNNVNIMLQVGEDDPTTRGVIDNDDCLNVAEVMNIKNGDCVYLKKGIEPLMDDIVLVSVDDELLLRHYEPHSRVVMFRSSFDASDDYAGIPGAFDVLGVCVAVSRADKDIVLTEAHKRTVN